VSSRHTVARTVFIRNEFAVAYKCANCDAKTKKRRKKLTTFERCYCSSVPHITRITVFIFMSCLQQLYTERQAAGRFMCIVASRHFVEVSTVMRLWLAITAEPCFCYQFWSPIVKRLAVLVSVPVLPCALF
jgi:hypothetical protein